MCTCCPSVKQKTYNNVTPITIIVIKEELQDVMQQDNAVSEIYRILLERNERIIALEEEMKTATTVA